MCELRKIIINPKFDAATAWLETREVVQIFHSDIKNVGSTHQLPNIHLPYFGLLLAQPKYVNF